MEASIKITLLICLTIMVVTGTITYGIVINELRETPYEQYLNNCQYSDGTTCAKVCTEEFREGMEDFTTKLVPLIEKVIEGYKNEN